jgi:hypothetical protein
MDLRANAALSLNKRRLLVRRVVEEGWSLTKAAEAAEVSTAGKWVRRFRAEGDVGLLDRSSAPGRVHNRTPEDRIEVIAALSRLRSPSPIRFNHKDTVESAGPSTSAICAAVILSRRSFSIASTSRAGSRFGLRLGRDERSHRPRSPSTRHLANQRYAVRSLTPAASPAAATDQPPTSIRSTSSLRLFGQVRALA